MFSVVEKAKAMIAGTQIGNVPRPGMFIAAAR